MEKKEKIDFMKRRIEFFYSEYRINARSDHRKYTFLDDFSEFCSNNYIIIDYCFSLGDYCKNFRKWLSDYKKWEQYKFNDDIIRKMGCLLMSLVIEALFLNENNKKLEEICFRLENR